jgi:uncharacterized protein (DUF2062 family)
LRGELESFKNLLQKSPEPELSWDFFSVRRTSLRVWWVLRREHSSPSRLATAIFVGVLIGCSPFYGFHVILCLVIAFVFRLNKFVVWLGSNVSLPVFAPFLTFASIQCGHILLHGEPAEVNLQQIQETGALELFWYWTIGFLPVGGFLGAFFALIVFFKLPPSEQSSP